MPTMQIARRDFDDVTVLVLSGRLVLGEGEPALRELIGGLIASQRTKVVLNLHEITYVDSCGLGVLAGEAMTLRRLGGDLKIVCPSPRCERLLVITHLLSAFERYESDEAAVQSFKPRPFAFSRADAGITPDR